MNKQRLKQAKDLATRKYVVVIQRDYDEAEEEYYYVAANPDIPGAYSVGATPFEAKANLEQARVDVIYFLLEDGLSIPEPKYAVDVKPADYKIVRREPSAVEDVEKDPSVMSYTNVGLQTA